MKEFFLALFGTALAISLMALNSLGLSLVWEWHIMEWLALPSLSWKVAFAVTIFAVYFKDKSDDDMELVEAVSRAILRSTAFWVLIFVAHLIR